MPHLRSYPVHGRTFVTSEGDLGDRGVEIGTRVWSSETDIDDVGECVSALTVAVADYVGVRPDGDAVTGCCNFTRHERSLLFGRAVAVISECFPIL
jgi:hypothetical protein